MNRHSVLQAVALIGVLAIAGCEAKPECGAKADSKAAIAAGSSITNSAPVDPLAPRYEATLSEGIDFKRSGSPNFLAAMAGLSNPEAWGTWSDGGVVTLRFRDALPNKFVLKIRAGAWGDNLNRPVKFRIGSVEKEFIFKGDPFNGASEAVMNFEQTTPSDTIQIIVPAPMANEGDTRTIGVGLISLKIETGSK